MARLIIFTDLDGTLLDHETYSFAPAMPTLERLAEQNVPVILASSKTAAEILPLQRELGLAAWPAIVENGAGVVWPDAEQVEGNGTACEDYAAILAVLERVEPALREKFAGFSGWTIEEVASRTGLSSEAAARARQRRFSEPGIFTGTDDERDAFVGALRALGLEARMGGRFLTVSRGATKAARMAEIVERLAGDEVAVTVALGDAPNDVEMLVAADLGVVVANPAHDPLPPLEGEAESLIVRTQEPGPAGWAKAVSTILDRVVGPGG